MREGEEAYPAKHYAEADEMQADRPGDARSKKLEEASDRR